MKKIFKTTVLIGSILLMTALFSCKKFLDIKPQSDLTTGNAYNSAQDLQNAVNGAYRAFYYEYYQWVNVLLGDMRADNSYIGGSGDPPLAEIDNVDIAVANAPNYNNWSQLYIGIGRCNVILDKVNSVNDPALDVNKLREQIIGQASFLRAFHYFQLVKLWGGVPIELNSNSADPSKTNLPRSSEKEVYDQIVKDLEVAVADLPDSYGSDETVNKVKATKGSANALLAKVWAQRSDRDYTKVLHYCNEVITSPAGYALMANYADLFDGSHYSNSESILEIAFVGGNWDVSNWGVELFLGLDDGWQKYCVPSKDLVAAYNNAGDNLRKDANITFVSNTGWIDENWNPCGDNTVAVPFNYKQKHPDGWNSGDRPYLLRLGDIILLKAEAQNETGDIAGALATLNIIRNRAALPNATSSSKEDLRSKILLERRLELAFEAHRWDDLVRMGVCSDVMNNLQEFKYTCEGGSASAPIKINYNVTQEKWLCPIPQLERDANPNLTQNPGYQ
ncbi:MAG: RagB/SusD family nutrient uptake outer membrane protein [Bacteroidota bacterium]